MNKILLILIIGLFCFPIVNATLVDNIKLYYKFDGDTKDAVGDWNMSNYNSTAFDSTLKKYNNAVNFTGRRSEKYANTSSFTMSLAEAYTISTWVYFNSSNRWVDFSGARTDADNAEDYGRYIGQGYDVACGTTCTGNGYKWWALRYVKATNATDFVIKYDTSCGSTSTFVAAGGTNSVPYGSWYHVVMIHDGAGNYNLLVNNVSKASGSTHPKTVGANFTGVPLYFNGAPYYYYSSSNKNCIARNYADLFMDETAIWDRALTTTDGGEVEYLYNGGSPGALQQYPFSSGDSCTYSGTGNWVITNNCNITTNVNLQTGYAMLIKTGKTVTFKSPNGALT